MANCNYTYEEIGFRGNKWISGCKKEILYIVPMGEGVTTPPLPTDNGAKFCTFCRKRIKLKTVEPRQQVELPKPPPPQLQSSSLPPQPSRPPKPLPLPRPLKVIKQDRDHNTYEGWKSEGFQVQRGEKSIGKDADGVAMFHRSQTQPANPPTKPYFTHPRCDDFEDDYDIFHDH